MREEKEAKERELKRLEDEERAQQEEIRRQRAEVCQHNKVPAKIFLIIFSSPLFFLFLVFYIFLFYIWVG
jgi:hypothetical protein